MLFRQLFDEATWTYTYFLADEKSKQAIIIDAVLEKVERDVALIEELGLTLKYAVDTHVYADHITGVRSAQAAQWLTPQGKQPMINVAGGMSTWLQMGYPVAS